MHVWIANPRCIPGACATCNFTYLVRGPWWRYDARGIFIESMEILQFCSYFWIFRTTMVEQLLWFYCRLLPKYPVIIQWNKTMERKAYIRSNRYSVVIAVYITLHDNEIARVSWCNSLNIFIHRCGEKVIFMFTDDIEIKRSIPTVCKDNSTY